MGAPYSLDLRQRAVGAVADGMSCAEAEELSGEPLLGDPLDEARSGDGEPGDAADGWQEAFALAGEEAWIRERVAEKPDLTGRELLGELNARGVDVSYYGVWNFLDHTGLSFKKKPRQKNLWATSGSGSLPSA